ncbi:MAG: response regulator transcription factor [bacterium]
MTSSGGPEPVVFVVDDDEAVRSSIAMLLESVSLKTETFASAREFLQAWAGDRPGCVVLDLRMPGLSGLELQERLAALGSRLPIIFVTGHGDVPDAVAAMRAGAVDFLRKPFRDQDLLDRIQKALELDAQRRSEAVDVERIRGRLARLTQREREVLDRVVEGLPNKTIAQELGVSERTVEIHRSRAMSKMEAGSLAELVKLVLRAGPPPATPG